jgi:hypothetical protein
MGKACRAISVVISVVGNSPAVRLGRASIAITARTAHRTAQELRLLIALCEPLASRRLSFGGLLLTVALTSGFGVLPKSAPATTTAFWAIGSAAHPGR